MQASLALVNIWQIPCALAPNFQTMLIGRFLGGISSAGGSVTLAIVADMYEVEEQQRAVAFVSFASVAGSVVGPVLGGFLQKYFAWPWMFWVSLIIGAVAQAVHYFAVPETRATTLLDREANRCCDAGEREVVGPTQERLNMKEVRSIWARPFVMFATEPIVLLCSLLSGFSDALIFTFLESFHLVFEQWGFGIIENGLAFISILIGYVIAYVAYLIVISWHLKKEAASPGSLAPEQRLWLLTWLAPLLPIGLIGFAWQSRGPSFSHWMSPMAFASLIAIANVSPVQPEFSIQYSD